MRDEFLNRLASFQTSLNTLNSTEHKPAWFNQNPVRFTTKVAESAQALTELEAFCRQQEAATTGASQQKEREETEAEDVAFTLGRALVTYFREHGNETDAAKADLPISGWRAFARPAIAGKDPPRAGSRAGPHRRHDRDQRRGIRD